MWITKAEFRELVASAGSARVEKALEDALAAQRDRADHEAYEREKAAREVVALSEQLGQLQSSFTWLTEHVNRLERERAELMARVLAVNFPAMRLDRLEAPDAPTPTQTRIVGRPAEDDYAGTIPALQAVGALFEDVGDEHAAALGARHDAMGNVTWTK